MSQSKVSRIESGRLTPSVADVDAIAIALGVSAEVKASLVDQASALQTEVHAWRALHGPSFRKHQEEIRQAERDAATIQQFNPITIPGLLQTPAYCRRVLQLARFGLEDLADAVASRMERQAVLYDEAKRLTFVVTESALRWRLVPVNVHLEQLDRLASVSAFGNVRLGVIALTADAPALPMNQFVLFDDQLVLVETLHGELTVKERGQIESYGAALDALDSLALHGDDARAFLARIADDLRQLGS
jgi:transcriptional regulator with XRE-family HTH domain